MHLMRWWKKYTCRRKTNRWPFTMLMYMIDAAALNSAILYNLKHPYLTGARIRRSSLEELSCDLIRSSACERYRESALKNHIGFNKNIMTSFNRIIKIQRAATEATNSCSTITRKRCYHLVCKGSNNREERAFMVWAHKVHNREVLKFYSTAIAYNNFI